MSVAAVQSGNRAARVECVHAGNLLLFGNATKEDSEALNNNEAETRTEERSVFTREATAFL